MLIPLKKSGHSEDLSPRSGGLRGSPEPVLRWRGWRWKGAVWTMENHGKQWCFRCPSRKMITKNREWRDESSKKIGFTISKHHKNQKSIIVKKHWYSEHSHPWFPVTGVGLPTRRAALPGRPCLRRRSARTLRRWRGDGVASARGSQAAAAVLCLGAKSGWWAGKKMDILGQCQHISCNIYTYLYWI